MKLIQTNGKNKKKKKKTRTAHKQQQQQQIKIQNTIVKIAEGHHDQRAGKNISFKMITFYTI